MSDMNCPYCWAEQQVCHDDGHGYDENIMHEHECSECGKTFVFETVIDFSYYPEKADCLNGGEHNLTQIKRYGHPAITSVPFRLIMRCNCCNFERAATEEEMRIELGLES